MARPANRMQEATERLMGRFQSHASILVSYSRGATVVSSLSATKGRSRFEVMDGMVLTAHESTHYLIDAADLTDFDEPRSGDVITEPDGSKSVVSIPGPLNLFERIGPLGSVFKIQTAGI